MKRTKLVILVIVICVVGGAAYIGYSAYQGIKHVMASGCVNCFQVNNGDGPLIKGSGHVASETRSVANFTSIALDAPADLVITRGGAQSLTVTGEDNLLPFFTSEVKDGTLYLAVAKGKSIQGSTLPVYRATVTDLRDVRLRGSGDIKAENLDGAALSATIVGSGDMHLAGRTDDFTLLLKGSGDVDAAKLQAKAAKVIMSGSGDATVNASDILDVQLQGSGSLHYVGAPKLTKNVSGSGEVGQTNGEK